MWKHILTVVVLWSSLTTSLARMNPLLAAPSVAMPMSMSISRRRQSDLLRVSSSSTTTIRGGAVSSDCANDTNAVVAYKIAANVALETAGMLGLFRLAQVASPKVTEFLAKNLKFLPTTLLGLPILQTLSAIFVVFSSSTLASWIQGGVSIATNQALRPNVVPGDSDWYANLRKPWFNPPGWVFPIMWLLISKPTQFVAVKTMLQQPSVPYWPVLSVYCAHLSLGDAWNEVFFGCQRVGLGAYVISTFYAFLLTSAGLISNVDSTAGKYMLPTCAWVTVATALNISIYQLNKSDSGEKTKK